MHDIAVIGGGLMGSSIALGLARAGERVLVLDGADLDARASRANFALIWVQGKGLGRPDYQLWSRRAARAWPEFARLLQDESGLDLALAQNGALSFALTDAELATGVAELEQIDRETAGRGAPWQVLDGKALRQMLPLIGPDVVGALHSPEDGHVNALRLFHALHRALHRRGVDYRANHQVHRIEPGPQGFAVQTNHGPIHVPRVVIAAGTGASALAAQVGISAPLLRSRGQVVVTQKCAPFMPWVSATIRQTDEGSVLIGDSEETDTDALTAGPAIAAVMAKRALRVFPHLARLNVLRSWTGFRVKSKDGMPIYQQSQSCPGAYVALCHSGVTLAALHAGPLARFIHDGSHADDLKPFSAARFHVPPH